jgi:hypothetical protein
MSKPINDHMTAAFRLAHRASESDRFDLAARNVFRAIAHEIWEAHGRPDDNEWPAGTVPAAETEERYAVARKHKAADAASGRDWQSKQGCFCGACRSVRAEVKRG